MPMTCKPLEPHIAQSKRLATRENFNNLTDAKSHHTTQHTAPLPTNTKLPLSATVSHTVCHTLTNAFLSRLTISINLHIPYVKSYHLKIFSTNPTLNTSNPNRNNCQRMSIDDHTDRTRYWCTTEPCTLGSFRTLCGVM